MVCDIWRGGYLTNSSLVLSLSLLLLFAGFFLINVAGVSIAYQKLLNSPGVVPVLVELRHTELDGRRGRLPHLQGDHRTGVDKASSTATKLVVYALVGVHAPPERSVLLA